MSKYIVMKIDDLPCNVKDNLSLFFLNKKKEKKRSLFLTMTLANKLRNCYIQYKIYRPSVSDLGYFSFNLKGH